VGDGYNTVAPPGTHNGQKRQGIKVPTPPEQVYIHKPPSPPLPPRNRSP